MTTTTDHPDILFTHDWTVTEAACRLTADQNETDLLALRIKDAIQGDQLKATAREIPYRPTLHDTVFKIRYGGIDPKDLPATETEYRIKPIDAIRWALDADIDVRPECIGWYRDRIKPGKRGPKGGPRDENVYKVIAGLALANGYRPGQKQAQGWRNKITRELDKKGVPLDPDKLTYIIKDAFDKLKIN